MAERDGMQRREFLKLASGAVAAGAAVTAGATPAFGATQGGGKYKKAVKFDMVKTDGTILEKFKLLKELGFDGVELMAPNDFDRGEVLRARDESGLPIHGVICARQWNQTLSDPDPKVRAQGVENLKGALRDSKAYGGTTVLLVVAKVTKEVSYADAYERSQKEIRKVIPLAEELGIRILFENVWNNFLLSPLEAARYVDEFETPVVGWYFDVGNVVRMGWPEHWIRILGKRIGKLDIKEYSRAKQMNEGLWKGFEVELLEGDCDWPAVMAALREIGFEGWGTAEIPGGGRDRLKYIAERMDRIFAS